MAKDPNKIDWSKVSREAEKNIDRNTPPLPSASPVGIDPIAEAGIWSSEGPNPHPGAERLMLNDQDAPSEEPPRLEEPTTDVGIPGSPPRTDPFTGGRITEPAVRMARQQNQRPRVRVESQDPLGAMRAPGDSPSAREPDQGVTTGSMPGSDQIPALLVNIITILERQAEMQDRMLNLLEERQQSDG